MPRDWKDTTGLRLGVEGNVTDHFLLFGGVAREQSPVPDRTVEPGFPYGDFMVYAAGFGYDFATISFDMAYSYHSFDSRNAAAPGAAEPGRHRVLQRPRQRVRPDGALAVLGNTDGTGSGTFTDREEIPWSVQILARPWQSVRPLPLHQHRPLAGQSGEHPRRVGGDPAGEGRGGDGERRGEPELAGPGAPLVVAVDGAETVTSSAVSETPGPQPMQAPQPGWMSCTPARSKVSAQAVLAREALDRLRAELDEEAHAGRDLEPASTASLTTWW